MSGSAFERTMTEADMRDYIALEVLKTLLMKLPVPGIPGGGQNHYGGGNQFAEQIARDSFEVATAFMIERGRRCAHPNVGVAAPVA
jgi:hypothetical protein